MKPTLADGYAIDVERLLETRMLLQASSGFGKSYALRRLLEQTAPKVQQLVIDPEGEFSTLRERYDYVICAPHDGDAIATPRTAALLARRLLETGVSAILNIYDLKRHERQAFVERFLTTLVDAPKALWRPVMIVLDEAHIFAPEKEKAESTGAVIDIASRGRKRGQCLIAATQRLAKLHKDVAAEMLNKMIGRCGLDIDVRRAADELGMTPKDAGEQFRGFDPGDFFIFGPALSPTVQRIAVGEVKTTHPKAGSRLMEAPPAPSAKIKGVIAAELADLPQQAETEIRTLEDAKRELAEVRRALTLAQKGAKTAPAAAAPKVDVRPYQKTIERLRAAVETLMKFIIEINAKDFTAKVDVDEAAMTAAIQSALTKATTLIEQKLDSRNREVAAIQKQGRQIADRIKRLVENDDVTVAVNVTHNEPFSVAPAPATSPMHMPVAKRDTGAAAHDGISGPQQRILDALAWLETIGVPQPSNAAAAMLARYSPSSTSYTNPRGDLVKLGLIEYPNAGFLRLTEAGRDTANFPDAPPTGEALRDRVLHQLSGPQRRLLEPLIAAYPEAMSNEDLAAAAGYSPTSTSFTNPRGDLSTLELVSYPQRGSVAASSILFPEHA